MAEAVPMSEAKLEVPIQSLINLPDGAGYSAAEGQASVSLQRRGDSVVVTGKCDSIARRCLYYESEAFRQHNIVDSLNALISRMNQRDSVANEMHSEIVETSDASKKKPPASWYKWLLAGIIIGLLLPTIIKKVKII